MIHVLVMYPRTEGTKFDGDYWVNTHMPLVSQHWPQAVKWEASLAGEDQPFYGAASIYFASMEDFGAAVGGAGGPVVMGDVANYTDTAPTLTILTVSGNS
jgi:uncharacterized protein (TIGR02118 family)